MTDSQQGDSKLIVFLFLTVIEKLKSVPCLGGGDFGRLYLLPVVIRKETGR